MREWLVTDGRGGFAMGTPEGTRRRKYHGFYLGIPGRAETCFLADLEIECGGEALWPHEFAAAGTPSDDEAAPVIAPVAPVPPEFRLDPTPSWSWRLESGTLIFRVTPVPSGSGMRLVFQWKPLRKRRSELRVRPFFAMRELHGNGGIEWSCETTQSQSSGQGQVAARNGREAFFAWKAPEDTAQWHPDAHWYRNFRYSEEAERGYQDREDLYSAGVLVFPLPGRNCEASLTISDRPVTSSRTRSRSEPSAIRDFVLEQPAGVVAGFPWFGEWGRDTFVALPGIVAARLESGEPEDRVIDWCDQVLKTWGDWIGRSGMIPNLIESQGAHQWESSDATLWWCHSLAALWSFGFEDLVGRHVQALGQAIRSITAGRHLFLRQASDGLLEVTEPHTTWMDARVDGLAVTPRSGKLPEINALWFQAHALHKLLIKDEPLGALEPLARVMLDPDGPVREFERPNRIFLHSIPLAPSFVFADRARAQADLQLLKNSFWTPVGLRTLSPSAPGFKARCLGPQRERDCAYHQGSVWPWLGGHYEMAAARWDTAEKPKWANGATWEGESPVQGHIPEILDAIEPYRARGAPAQAWSLACFAEASFRRTRACDDRLSRKAAERKAG